MPILSNEEKVQNADLMPPWPQFCCPSHLIPLVQHSGRLDCEQGEQFEIRGGVPRFVPQNSYADGFGAQWKKYRLTQLDSYSGVPITEMRLRNCLGEDLWGKLAGKQVLECGCGAGRFTEHLLEKGAFVSSVDLSDAVDANNENFPEARTHRVVQADILRLPFQPGNFDVVLCIGVIQHTPNSEQTIRALSTQVKLGGYLVMDHYTYTLAEFTKAAALIRPIVKRFSPAAGIRHSEQLVKLFLPLHRRVRRIRWMQMLLSRVSPVTCYYHRFPQLNEELQTEWALLDTHDYLTCWYRHYRTSTEIARLLRSIGFEDVFCEYGGNGVEARAKRAAQSFPTATTAA
jgi:2-polyprenyl-3-methyl-5-hydroxy-6-metoxy-1,4-benzoquinol methylase